MDAPSLLAGIAHLDEQIDTLQDQRDQLTYQLERLAERWYTEHPPAPQRASYRARKCCSAAHFTYASHTDTHVQFGTDCSWCGQNQAAGASVPRSWLDPALAAGD